jgi:chemotaxis protein MotB
MLSVERKAKEEISTSLQVSRQLARAREENLSTQLSHVQKEVNRAQESLSLEQQTAAEAQAQVDALTGQLKSFNEQVSKLSKALNIPESPETINPEEKVKNIATTLDEALVRKVEELAKYRSNFFGKLQTVLGDRPEIQIVGDRFILSSEVLFPSASARLSEEGRQQLIKLGSLLKDVMHEIPDDINWVLRVDGHTDARPIRSETYPSNWELSFARAMAVVRFLVTQGISPQRLAAAGFGEFQPLVEGESAKALRENRRIELKLDQR